MFVRGTPVPSYDSTIGRSTVSDASAAASPPIRAQKKALGESCLLVVVALHLA